MIDETPLEAVAVAEQCDSKIIYVMSSSVRGILERAGANGGVRGKQKLSV